MNYKGSKYLLKEDKDFVIDEMKCPLRITHEHKIIYYFRFITQ